MLIFVCPIQVYVSQTRERITAYSTHVVYSNWLVRLQIVTHDINISRFLLLHAHKFFVQHKLTCLWSITMQDLIYLATMAHQSYSKMKNTTFQKVNIHYVAHKPSLSRVRILWRYSYYYKISEPYWIVLLMFPPHEPQMTTTFALLTVGSNRLKNPTCKIRRNITSVVDTVFYVSEK